MHLYEPCVLKKQALKLLESDIPDDFAYDVQRLREALEKFEDIDENLVPKDSLLREFLGWKGESNGKSKQKKSITS